MKNALGDREKALESEFIRKKEKELLEQAKKEAQDRIVREICHNRCPKCGEVIEPLTFRGVPLDKCPGCGGVWLGPKDLQILASKDHRSWFEKWFKGEEE